MIALSINIEGEHEQKPSMYIEENNIYTRKAQIYIELRDEKVEDISPMLSICTFTYLINLQKV